MTSVVTPVQRPEPEVATHPLQPPMTDIKSNTSMVDCPTNELASELAFECLHTPDAWQKVWTHFCKSVTDIARLKENLADFSIADAGCSRRQCCTAWLDLTNAFESVPHGTIFTSLQWAGLNEGGISVIRHLYAVNTTTIHSHQGLTPEISIQVDVKQGCL